MAVKYDLPVVLHERGPEHEATQRAIEILQRTLPSQHPIHVHCFSGDAHDFHMWLEAFPVAIFGVTATISGQEPTFSTLRQIPLQKLVPETDAPYLVPPHLKQKACFSNPGMIVEAVRVVEEAKRMIISTVCEVTRSVAKSL